MRVRIAAVTMVRDEADVIVPVVERLLTQGVDRVFVIDHGSTDGTRDLLADLARRTPLDVFDETDPRYLQAEKVTALALRVAATHRPRWILPFDADEWWTLPRLPWFGADVRSTPIIDHVATGLDDPSEPNPVRRLRWRQREGHYQKVLVRWRPHFALEMGNHHVLRKGKRVETAPLEGLELRHFPARSQAQMARKYLQGRRALEAAGGEIAPTNGAHWRALGDRIDRGGAVTAREIWLAEHFVADPRGVLVEDPAPGVA